MLAQLEERLSGMPDKPDVLTLSGAGEPTLYGKLGELILAVKGLSDIPVAVITNSSLLDRDGVRDELRNADIVLPSLDTALEHTFQRLNRPHELCGLDRIIDGLERFTRDFAGTILLEILLVDGFNTDTENLYALRRAVGRLRVDSVQLNTAVRPGTVRGITPLGGERLAEAGRVIAPNCEIITDATVGTDREDTAIIDRIIALVARRPSTAEDLHRALGVPIHGITKLLTRLAGEGRIVSEAQGDKTFYIATERSTPR